MIFYTVLFIDYFFWKVFCWDGSLPKYYIRQKFNNSYYLKKVASERNLKFKNHILDMRENHDPIKIRFEDLCNPLHVINYIERASSEVMRIQKDEGLGNILDDGFSSITNVFNPKVGTAVLRAVANYTLLSLSYGVIIFGAHEGIKNYFY